MYQKDSNSILKHLDFVILDLLVIELSFFLMSGLRQGFGEIMKESSFNLMVGIFVIVHLTVVIMSQAYQDILRRGYLVEMKRVVQQNTLMMIIIFSFMFVAKLQIRYSRSVFLLTWMISTALLFVERVIWKNVARKRLRNSDNRSHLLLISDAEMAEYCLGKLKEKKYQSYKVTGLIIYNRTAKGAEVQGIPVVADRDDIFEYTRTHVVDEVLLNIKVPEDVRRNLTEHFLEMGVTVHIQLSPSEQDLPNAYAEQIGECSVLTTSIKTATTFQVFVKRTMDIVGSLFGLLATGIFLLTFGPIIYIQSPGPVFFSQMRVGKNGRKFRIYKFRSMYMDAEERKKELMKENKMNGLMFKMDDDPRIIPIGKFIRKFSIDEFPQFWNVLKGDMSLVGTRPPTVDEYEQYDLHHKVRLSIKPGLTGMWQVSGRSDITDFEEVVQLDNKYIREWSIRLDIKILFATVAAVLGSKGSV
ncbi:MAG: sugar transferase [Oliverpabstia sp.]